MVTHSQWECGCKCKCNSHESLRVSDSHFTVTLWVWLTSESNADWVRLRVKVSEWVSEWVSKTDGATLSESESHTDTHTVTPKRAGSLVGQTFGGSVCHEIRISLGRNWHLKGKITCKCNQPFWQWTRNYLFNFKERKMNHRGRVAFLVSKSMSDAYLLRS